MDGQTNHDGQVGLGGLSAAVRIWVNTPESLRRFREVPALFRVLRRGRLCRLENPMVLMDFFGSPACTPDERNEILGGLVLTARGDGPGAPVAGALLWLALSPAVDERLGGTSLACGLNPYQPLTVVHRFLNAVKMADLGSLKSLGDQIVGRTVAAGGLDDQRRRPLEETPVCGSTPRG